jgi:hypothetical protein
MDVPAMQQWKKGLRLKGTTRSQEGKDIWQDLQEEQLKVVKQIFGTSV